MTPLESQLGRWQDAGLLDADTAERIRHFEGGEPAPSEPASRPGAMEAVVYLGVAVIAAGAVVLTAANWGNLSFAVRLGVPGLSGVLAFLIGGSMLRSNSPQLMRGGQLAWLLSLALLATTWAIAADQAGMRGEETILISGLAVLAVGTVFWLWSPAHAQLSGIAAGCVLTAIGLTAETGGDYGGVVFGVSLSVMAFFGIFLTEAGVLRPLSSGRLLFCLCALLGAAVAGITGPGGTEVIGLIVGSALIALSLSRGVFVYIGFGVAVLFIALLTLVLRHVDDPTEAGLALTGMGLALLAGILVLARLRPWARARREPTVGAN